MMSDEEKAEYIDNLIPQEIVQAFTDEAASIQHTLDFISLVEKARVHTIKQKISSSHKWFKATCVNEDNSSEERFWCENCNIQCSEFENINCLSIISKVKDGLPTYTTHNKYLTSLCDEILNFQDPNPEKALHCFQCGIPARGKTNECIISDHV